jgi:hypothetical protein
MGLSARRHVGSRVIAGFFDMAIFARTSSSVLGLSIDIGVMQIKSTGYGQFYVS